MKKKPQIDVSAAVLAFFFTTALTLAMAAATAEAAEPAEPAEPAQPPASCDVARDAKPLVSAAPMLVKSSPLPERFWSALQAVDFSEVLEVDERVQRFTITGHRPLSIARLPLALPAPWRGSVDFAPRVVEARAAGAPWCARAEVVLFDKELRHASLAGLPVDITVTFTKNDAPARTRTIAHDSLVLGPRTVDALRDGAPAAAARTRLWIGNGAPGEDALLLDGVDTYMEFLTALGPGVVEDIRAHPSRDAQRVLFAEAAASWRDDLAAWLPRKRIDTIAKFDEKAMPTQARPLLRFWKQELTPGKIAMGAGANSARLIVDDAVLALWIEGIEVFDRAKGSPTSIELKAPKAAVRAWIVTRSGAGGQVVHDTRAVLRAGEIYAVTSTFVQHARGGARRECARVVGALPFEKDILWREISNAPSTRPGPMLGADETFRPSVASAERAITVVPGGDTRPFPPVPLVYSYTHEGLYKWTLAKDGGVKLELVNDEKLCPDVSTLK